MVVTVVKPEESWFQRNEIPRKFLHGSIAVLTTFLYFRGVQFSQVTPVLIAMLIPIVLLEYLRFASPKFNKMYIAVVGPLMRESEKNGTQINGVIWYLVGLIVTMAVFPKDVSLLALYQLSWADLAASTVGRAYGYLSPKIVGNKSLAGSLAAFAVGVMTTIFMYKFLFANWPEYNTPSMLMYNEHLSKISVYTLAIIVGIAAMVSELLPVVDDNLSIPIFCSCVAWLTIKMTTLPYSYGVLA